MELVRTIKIFLNSNKTEMKSNSLSIKKEEIKTRHYKKSRKGLDNIAPAQRCTRVTLTRGIQTHFRQKPRRKSREDPC